MKKEKISLDDFPKTFWVANSMELFERLAWYGIFMVLALYLTGSVDEGALGFSQTQKGTLMGTVTFTLFFLPLFTGAIADKLGYKKTLIISYLILSSGYLLAGFLTDYSSLFIVFMYIAIGAGLFKPVISATISKTTNKKTASMGFGIFYMIVNVGAFIGPIFASIFRDVSWKFPFIIASAAIAINIILVIVFYKEPLEKRKKEALFKTLTSIVKNILTALKDWKFVIFLLIVSGFWTMYNQLFFTLTVFIEQWVNTSGIYNFLNSFWPWLAGQISIKEGSINPEMIANIDALYIVIFQVLVTSLIMKFKPINTIITGFLVSSIGIGLWFITQNGSYLFISILIFGLGEMASSPRILEYINIIAPKDKVALYMGCYYLPLAIGNFFTGILSGSVYENMSDKLHLLQEEVSKRGLQIQEISETFTQNDYFRKAEQLLGFNSQQLTDFLWQNYQPYNFWMVVTGIGVGTTLLLIVFDRVVIKKRP